MTDSEITCCLSYAGDEYDNSLRFILGHHPSCPYNKIEIPSYHYKVNLFFVLQFLEDKIFVRKEFLLETALKIMNTLEETEGQKIYRERHAGS